MVKAQIKRITVNDLATVSFDTITNKWLVKNFSLFPIYVSFENPVDEDKAIRINKGIGQVVITNERPGAADCNECSTLYISGRGEVEVQQLDFE